MSHSFAYSVDDYKIIIDVIHKKHDQYNQKWLQAINRKTYNLKRKQVRHITSDNPQNIRDFIDIDFLEYMESYKEGLYSLYTEIVMELTSNHSIPIIGRVKNDDSIVSKLYRKRFEDKGKFAINKYLNDLLGFRIVDQKFDTNIEGLIEYIDSIINNGKIRMRTSERRLNDYKAFHIYFMGISNECFPVELQVWGAKDECNNLKSHKIYKKDYASWPIKYQDG